MKVIIESTTKGCYLNGIWTRIWEGKTESGIPVHCFIAQIAVPENQDQSQFEKELQEHRPPRPEIQTIPLRMIL